MDRALHGGGIRGAPEQVPRAFGDISCARFRGQRRPHRGHGREQTAVDAEAHNGFSLCIRRPVATVPTVSRVSCSTRTRHRSASVERRRPVGFLLLLRYCGTGRRRELAIMREHQDTTQVTDGDVFLSFRDSVRPGTPRLAVLDRDRTARAPD